MRGDKKYSVLAEVPLTFVSQGWIQLNNSDIYYSTARDMARFGLLILNEGVWDEEFILNDTNYFSNMVNTSQ